MKILLLVCVVALCSCSSIPYLSELSDGNVFEEMGERGIETLFELEEGSVEIPNF